MKYETYMQNIMKKFHHHFDIRENYSLKDYNFDYLAEFHERSEKYFASKKIVLDGMENNEYCFFTYVPDMGLSHFNHLTHILEDALLDIVEPTSEHMSTLFTCIIIAENIDDDHTISMLKKYRYSKSFLFNFKGWAKIRFVLVDLSSEKIYTSKGGERLKKVYDFIF